ncbi:Uncharacterised protein [Serratia grimesii]|uniref:hypothetical protein n=1 Tax=Serratia grimesii TaxID=82995 RepID=UPI00076F3EB8|nr:hypothetical protein [Serratia grimesii]CUW11700.1 Uncharacterised protein [Serratia grimesii]SMZ56177.1 Uncharacterised protein [Serratia grimesii]
MQGQEWFVYFQITYPNGEFEEKELVWYSDLGVFGSVALTRLKEHLSSIHKVSLDKIIVKTFNKI